MVDDFSDEELMAHGLQEADIAFFHQLRKVEELIEESGLDRGKYMAGLAMYAVSQLKHLSFTSHRYAKVYQAFWRDMAREFHPGIPPKTMEGGSTRP